MRLIRGGDTRRRPQTEETRSENKRAEQPAAEFNDLRHAERVSCLAMTVMFLVGVGLVIARRPDSVSYPQFWAEDGSIWFRDAYTFGIAAVGRSDAGYLQTLPRLVAEPATHLSLQHAALLFNLVGIVVQVAPAAFFVSRRFERVVPRIEVRALAGLVYLLIPSYELNATITDAQWHLAVLAALVLISQAPSHLLSRLFDLATLLLCGLTGPFAAVLFPAALLRIVLTRQRGWHLWLAGVLAVTLAVQAWAVTHSQRPIVALGAGLRNLLFLISDRVVLPASLAEEGHTSVFTEGRVHGAVLAGLIALLAAAIVGVVMIKGEWHVRIFVLFCFVVTATALASPLVPPGLPAWTTLATSGGADRYFFTAELGWLVCVMWVVSRMPVPWRWVAGGAMAALFVSGLARYPQYPAYVDYHPATYDARLHAAPPGTDIVIPINPPGFTMTLAARR